ncbi:hypothetical protein EGW08_017685 [Elysia chlorotica]|uniref:Uncharacterized protein n=1 Tax=Elysia chlorotica TaxID=188477 RepID=A0A433SZG5_ELYCH|nr:hypothetical protein EGW08_017685 [Elysia chlorotica]
MAVIELVNPSRAQHDQVLQEQFNASVTKTTLHSWKKLAFHMLSLTLVQAHILHNKFLLASGKRPWQLCDFAKNICLSLVMQGGQLNAVPEEDAEPLVSVDRSAPQTPAEVASEKDRKIRSFSCKYKKDICMLSYFMGQQIFSGTQTQTNRRLAKERTKRHTSYSYMSRSVCRETFKFMLDISQNKLSAVTKHFAAHGLVTRKKNSGGASANTNALTDGEKEQIILFLKGNAVLLCQNSGGASANTNALTDGEKEQIILFLKGAHDRHLWGLPKSDPCTAVVQQRHNGMTMEEKAEVHLPHSPMQPGPIYLLVTRKCGLFGVSCEALPQQINFCIDEGVCVGLHTSVSLHFMLPGHTKFAPDWCYGILKRAFKKAEVHSFQDLSHVINLSTKSGINKAAMVGDEKGAIDVRTYDWQSFFRKYSKPFPGIKSKQHFYLSSSDLGYAKASLGIKSKQHFYLSSSDLGYAKASLGIKPKHHFYLSASDLDYAKTSLGIKPKHHFYLSAFDLGYAKTSLGIKSKHHFYLSAFDLDYAKTSLGIKSKQHFYLSASDLGYAKASLGIKSKHHFYLSSSDLGYAKTSLGIKSKHHFYLSSSDLGYAKTSLGIKSKHTST